VAATRALLGRNSERATLEQAWRAASDGDAQLCILWGRRRVGKTFLAADFMRGKRGLFFGATQQSEGVELRRLAEVVRRDLGSHAEDLMGGGGLASWEAALRFLAALAAESPLAVVLDEVPYLARSTPGFPSIVQVVWDHLRPGSKLLLVLVGSAVGIMEDMVGPGGALRGRPTVRLRLDPLDLWSAREFLPGVAAVPLFEAYAACGGYPLHLRAWDRRASTADNLLRLGASPGGLLLEDAESILREELPSSGGYSRILAAVGRGRCRASEIAAEADQRIEHPLDVLVRAGFVRRSLPVGAPRKARPLYEIGDPYLAFWFGVLYSELALIDAGQGGAVLRRRNPQWQRHLGWAFEELARAHAGRLASRGALLDPSPEGLVVGRWWASTGEPCEIDVLGLAGSGTVLLGEARWQKRPLGTRDLRALMAKTQRVPRPIESPAYVLWGRERIDPAARSAGAVGFDLSDIVEDAPAA
jgi:hypothetical protein